MKKKTMLNVTTSFSVEIFTVVISLNFTAYFSNLPITPNDGVLKLFLSNAQFRFFNNL